MFAGSEMFHFLSPPNCTLMMSGEIYRPADWEPNPPAGMHLDTHIHAHPLTNALKASTAGGVEMLVSLEMPVETLSFPFTQRTARDKRADKWMR